MDVEQRYVISYYLKKSVKPKKIIEKLQKVYGPKAYQRSDIYRWIGIIKGGRDTYKTFISQDFKISINIFAISTITSVALPFGVATM